MTRPLTPQDKDKWAAQRQEKLTALQGQLADGLQQLMEATGWMTWLKVAHHFHTYSLNNQILIAIQNPSATQVAGSGPGKQLVTRSAKAKKESASWPPSPHPATLLMGSPYSMPKAHNSEESSE
ncbi:hypothetical protein [Tessaracoccus antarcticus]|nr:hypothetical protein [Tessaracoccus antarcticus]